MANAPLYLDDTDSTRFDGLARKESDGIATTSLAHDRQSARWDLTDALRSSDHIRAGASRWLPIFPGEKPREYTARLKRSHLLSAYHDAIEKLVSKPFSRSVTFAGVDDLDPMLAAMHEDPARDGTGQTPFWRAVFREALDRGVTFVLVDFQQTGGSQSLGAERALNLHPYFVHVAPAQLIGVDRRQRESDGRYERERIRVHFCRLEKVGEFGEMEVEYIHLYQAPLDASGMDEVERVAAGDAGMLVSTFESWRRDPETKKWEPFVAPTPYSFEGIPLAALYFCKEDEDEGRPCLWRLAEVNLEHWQKKSDRDNLLHVAQVPLLMRYGWTAAELQKPIVAGAGRSGGTTQKDARTEYVDASPAAAALEMSSKEIEHIEEQMERLGLEPLVRRASASLATNMAIGDAKEMNLLQAWALALEDFIIRCYDLAAEWIGAELPESFSVDVFSEYGLSSRATENLDLLDKARARGDISHQTYLEELKRYAALAESVDVEEEMERIEEEKLAGARMFNRLRGEAGGGMGGENGGEDGEGGAGAGSGGGAPPPFGGQPGADPLDANGDGDEDGNEG